MSQPNFSQVDEQLRGVLLSALQRDPSALRNGDHLHALLADLAPDMPIGLRNACIAVARTNATSWLTQTPPYTQEQVVAWLRAQFPDLLPDPAHQAIATIASLSAAPPVVAGPVAPPPPPSPVFEKETVAGAPFGSQPTVLPPTPEPVPGPVPGPVPAPYPGPGFGGPMAHPSLPPNAASWPPPPPPRRGPKVALIVGLVLILLAGAGVGAYFLLHDSKGTSTSATRLAAPQNVKAMPHEGDSVMVTWQPVADADHYVVTDTSGALDPQTVDGPLCIFDHAADADHQFVVKAYTADGDAGPKSEPAMWMRSGPPGAPASLTVVREGYNLHLTWPAVDGAEGYEVRDTDNSSFAPDPVQGTSFVVHDASLTPHHFTVRAVRGGQPGAAAAANFSPRNTLTAGEATLAYRLQTNMVVPGSCESLDAAEPHLVSAAISCKPVGSRLHKPTSLYVIQLKPGTQNTYESKRWSGMDAQNGCGQGSDYPASGVHGQWYVKGDPKPRGDTYCYISASNYAVWAWTDYRENVVLEAIGRGQTTRSGLWNWWYNAPSALR